MGDHPWRRLRHMPDWELVWTRLPEGVLGYTDHEAQRIVLERRQLQAERRSTLAHELAHANAGPTLDHPWWQARDESWAKQEAARRLIGIDALADALAWSHSLAEAASELWVDISTLQTRLDHLHPSERAVLRRRLESS